MRKLIVEITEDDNSIITFNILKEDFNRLESISLVSVILNQMLNQLHKKPIKNPVKVLNT